MSSRFIPHIHTCFKVKTCPSHDFTNSPDVPRAHPSLPLELLLMHLEDYHLYYRPVVHN